MTDRIHSLTVVLERDLRDDDVAGLIDAIKHFRCVVEVTPHVADGVTHMAVMRAKAEMRNKLLGLFEVLED